MSLDDARRAPETNSDADAPPTASKPYLDATPSTDWEETALRWMHFLGDTFGASGALSALRYYEELGWISAEVRGVLIDHLRTLSLEEIHTKKYGDPVTVGPPLSSLDGSPFGAHAQSLKYVAAIADDDLEEALLLTRIADHRTAD